MKKKVPPHGPLSSNCITCTHCMQPLYSMYGTQCHCSLHRWTWGEMHGCRVDVWHSYTVNVALFVDGGATGPGPKGCIGGPALSSEHTLSGPWWQSGHAHTWGSTHGEEFALGIDPKSLHATVLIQTVYNAVVRHSGGFLKHVAISVIEKSKDNGGVDWVITNAVTMT